MATKVYTIVEKIPAEHFEDGPELPAGLVVHEYTGPTYGCIRGDMVAISLKPGETPFYGIPADAVEELTHLPRLDANGNPTDYGRCDIDGGRVSAGSAHVNCERCLEWDDIEHDDEAED